MDPSNEQFSTEDIARRCEELQDSVEEANDNVKTTKEANERIQAIPTGKKGGGIRAKNAAQQAFTDAVARRHKLLQELVGVTNALAKMPSKDGDKGPEDTPPGDTQNISSTGDGQVPVKDNTVPRPSSPPPPPYPGSDQPLSISEDLPSTTVEQPPPIDDVPQAEDIRPSSPLTETPDAQDPRSSSPPTESQGTPAARRSSPPIEALSVRDSSSGEEEDPHAHAAGPGRSSDDDSDAGSVDSSTLGSFVSGDDMLEIEAPSQSGKPAKSRVNPPLPSKLDSNALGSFVSDDDMLEVEVPSQSGKPAKSRVNPPPLPSKPSPRSDPTPIRPRDYHSKAIAKSRHDHDDGQDRGDDVKGGKSSVKDDSNHSRSLGSSRLSKGDSRGHGSKGDSHNRTRKMGPDEDDDDSGDDGYLPSTQGRVERAPFRTDDASLPHSKSKDHISSKQNPRGVLKGTDDGRDTSSRKGKDNRSKKPTNNAQLPPIARSKGFRVDSPPPNTHHEDKQPQKKVTFNSNTRYLFDEDDEDEDNTPIFRAAVHRRKSAKGEEEKGQGTVTLEGRRYDDQEKLPSTESKSTSNRKGTPLGRFAQLLESRKPQHIPANRNSKYEEDAITSTTARTRQVKEDPAASSKNHRLDFDLQRRGPPPSKKEPTDNHRAARTSHTCDSTQGSSPAAENKKRKRIEPDISGSSDVEFLYSYTAPNPKVRKTVEEHEESESEGDESAGEGMEVDGYGEHDDDDDDDDDDHAGSMKPLLLARARAALSSEYKGWPKNPDAIPWKTNLPDEKGIKNLYRVFVNVGLGFLRKKYDRRTITMVEKAEYQRFGRQAIKIFAAAKNPLVDVPLPRSFRIAIHKNQEIAPNAATTSITLSNHVLSSGPTTRCPSDWERNPRIGYKSADERNFGVHGKYGREKAGSLTCDCSSAAAIWELFTWKIWLGKQGDDIEPMPFLSPRHREFVSQNTLDLSLLTMEDIFLETGGNWRQLSHQITLRKRQLRRVKERLAELEA
ncbi:hypothetical protein BDN72DRAFT_677777 [Pluteus cervinus]|uniref:Uncharacterized protein n=1 Tax=Pluteus cervinus TaxID=181527 RepID=A0ACD2ZZM0_9AGAR|nr:hypothetical protein BDN72DRAFT_677777 [Pluteus cervinus]